MVDIAPSAAGQAEQKHGMRDPQKSLSDLIRIRELIEAGKDGYKTVDD